MEQLIVLAVIIGASLLHGWWKKRQEENEAESESGPVQSTQRRQNTPQTGLPPSPSSPAANWEEALRRMLQGEESPQRRPPPVVVPAPPPLPPPVASRPVAYQRPAPVSQSDPDMDRGLSMQMPTLEHSAHAFLRASQLEAKVAEHMHRAGQPITSHKKIELKKKVTPEIRQALDLVRHRQSQRAAIIAGIVLGPAKAMEG